MSTSADIFVSYARHFSHKAVSPEEELAMLRYSSDISFTGRHCEGAERQWPWHHLLILGSHMLHMLFECDIQGHCVNGTYLLVPNTDVYDVYQRANFVACTVSNLPLSSAWTRLMCSTMGP